MKLTAAVLMALAGAGAPPPAVVESARGIPVAASADVVVVGGSVAAVAAAMEAARQGRSVFLVSSRPHLGEDLSDTLHLWLEEGEKPTGALSEKIFAQGSPAAPIRVKKTLEDGLTGAGVRFVLTSFAVDVLQDAAGRPAGIVLANRAGRQAVIAKTIVDATTEASIAQSAGARLEAWSGGEVEFRRVVLGGGPAGEEAVRRRVSSPDGKLTYHEYGLRLELPDLGPLSLLRADQQARDRSYRPGQLRAAGKLQWVPPNPIVARAGASWSGFEQLQAAPFQPRGVDRVFVAGPRAAIPRTDAALLWRPTVAEAMGRFLGGEAARQAARLPEPRGISLPPAGKPHAGGLEVREDLTGLRPTDKNLPVIPSAARELPVLGTYDVLVVGGGTSGAAAAIGAARQGLKTLVVEYQDGLGGTGTLGLIGKPYHGRQAGFSREVPFPDTQRTIDDKMEWYRSEIRNAGGEIWFNALGAGAVLEGQRVRGAVIALAERRGVVLAQVVIDATGNADVAAAAGAATMYGAEPDDIALQGAGFPTWRPGQFYVNTDYLLVDETDLVDVWRALVGARQVMDDSAWDSGTLIQTRERRRVVGDHVLSYLDQITGRKYPDSIVYSASDYDSHGYPSDDFFALIPHDEKSRLENHPAPGGACYTPYRCLLPRGLDGILVTGLGISMHRDASAMVRMQLDLANQGYAAGLAASLAVRGGIPLRQIDVRALQRRLVEMGGLPPETLEHTDSFPRPAEEIRAAVELLPRRAAMEEAGRRIGLILTHKDTALPMLRSAHAASEGPARLVYARLLGMLGERAVIAELSKALDEAGPWDPRILQGKMAEYAHLPTPIDTLILALGRTRDPRAMPSLLRRLETLDDSVTLSHHRSLALALESLGGPTAAAPLARLLAKPGMRGHAMKGLEPLHDADMNRRRRIGPLREITLARALYRCGDHQGLGQRILREYQGDVRGLFARHASAVLASRKP